MSVIMYIEYIKLVLCSCGESGLLLLLLLYYTMDVSLVFYCVGEEKKIRKTCLKLWFHLPIIPEFAAKCK